MKENRKSRAEQCEHREKVQPWRRKEEIPSEESGGCLLLA